MRDHGAPRFAPPALLLCAGLSLAAFGGWQSGCDRPEHLVEVQQGDCYTCHVAEYEDPTNVPPHMEAFAGLSSATECAQCHVTTAWTPVEHPWFPLENAHDGPTCAACHTQGYAPGQTPTDCVGCHADDYQASPHGTAYSDRCSSCHTTVAWLPATEAHPEDRFPIRSGPHESYANDCSGCHDSSLGASLNGANTNCVGCHDGEHTRARMDAKHDEVDRCDPASQDCYPIGDAPPNFCLFCHERGEN